MRTDYSVVGGSNVVGSSIGGSDNSVFVGSNVVDSTVAIVGAIDFHLDIACQHVFCLDSS